MRNPESPLIQAMPDFYVDLQNAAALLLRLELRGVDVGDRWGEIADLCEQRIGNHTSPFTSAHCGLALAAAGRDEKLDELLKAMEDFASTDEGTMGPRYRAAVLAACRAASAHRRDDHREVLRRLCRRGGACGKHKSVPPSRAWECPTSDNRISHVSAGRGPCLST